MLRITVTTLAGSEYHDTLKELSEMATLLKAVVSTTFNGMEIVAFPDGRVFAHDSENPLAPPKFYRVAGVTMLEYLGDSGAGTPPTPPPINNKTGSGPQMN